MQQYNFKLSDIGMMRLKERSVYGVLKNGSKFLFNMESEEDAALFMDAWVDCEDGNIDLEVG